MDSKKIILFVLRLLVGITFVASSILKLYTLESFELYVYSLGVFSYTATAFFARVLIMTEFLLGIGISFRIFYKQVWWLTMAMLVGFSLFLIYIALFRSNDNCHCFGDVVDLNAAESIIKNIVLIAMLWFVRKQEEWHHSLKAYIATISIMSSVFVAFFGFPMDSMYSLFYADKNERFNQSVYDKVVVLPEYSTMIDSSKNMVIGLVSETCKYCKSGNTIMAAIIKQNNLDTADFKNLVMSRNSAILDTFKTVTNTQQYEYRTMNPSYIISLNNGYFPTYLFIEKGKVIKAANYKQLDEKELVKFLGGKQ